MEKLAGGRWVGWEGTTNGFWEINRETGILKRIFFKFPIIRNFRIEDFVFSSKT